MGQGVHCVCPEGYGGSFCEIFGPGQCQGYCRNGGTCLKPGKRSPLRCHVSFWEIKYGKPLHKDGNPQILVGRPEISRRDICKI